MTHALHRRPSAVIRCLRAIARWSLALASWLRTYASSCGVVAGRMFAAASPVVARWSDAAVRRFPALARWSDAMARRFPAVGRLPRRNAILGIAGLAIVGGAIVGPIAAQSGPAEAASASSGVTQLSPGGARVGAAASSTAAVPSSTLTPVPPVLKAEPTPFEKALYPDFRLQPNYYYCGPAATRLAITAHGQASPSMDDLAWMLGTTTGGTDSAEDTTRVLNRVLGAGIYHTREIPGQVATAAQMDRFRQDVVDAISNGYAAVANVVGATADVNGGWHDYPGGHYVSVVGYGQGGMTMKIADPADTQGDGTYWVNTADVANWMGTRGYSA